MPDAQALTVFFVSALVMVVVPGPAVTYVVARTLAQDAVAGVVSSLGLCTGLLLHLGASVAGVSAALARWPATLDALRLLGGGYLVWLGLSALTEARATETGAEVAEDLRTAKRLFWDGFVIDTLNPKPALFLLAFLPLFTDPRRPLPVPFQLLSLGLLFTALALATNIAYALAVGRLSSRLRRTPRAARVQRYVSAAFLLGLGILAWFEGGSPYGG